MRQLNQYYRMCLVLFYETIHRKAWLGSPETFWLAEFEGWHTFCLLVCHTGQRNTIKIILIDW